MVMVTATDPAEVAIGSSRTPANNLSAATDNSSGVQLVMTTANLLPEIRPKKSLPRTRARMRLATSAMTFSVISKP